MTNQRTADFIGTMEIIHAKYQDHLKDKPHIKEQQQLFLEHQRKAPKVPCSEAGPADSGPEKLLHQATAALERQEWEVAEGCLRDLMRSYPDLLEPYLTLSDVLTLQGKHREAGEVLRAARQVDPEALSLLKRLGLNCRQRGDLSGAMAAFTKAWSQNPQDSKILGLLAATCIDLGLFQEAKSYFAEAIRINPKNIELWLGLAQTASHLEDQDTFGQACRQAAALDPAYPRLLELAPGLIPEIGNAAPPPPGEVPSLPVRGLSSIIIPVFNNLSLTRQCLESIWDNTDFPHEIIVVDNGSSDGTRDYLNLLEAAGEVRVIANCTNLGFARASNQGAQAAKGEYLVFLNNDTIVQRGWLRELVACARKDKKTGAVGAKLLYPDDTVQHAGVTFNKDTKFPHHIYRNYDRDHPAVNKEREFQAVTGACMLIRKDLFMAVGAFDEAYRNGLEDVDLCFKLRDQGHKIVYNPRAVVYHLESKTPGRHDREKENSRRFNEKWSDKIIGDDHKYHQEDDIFIEEIERRGNVSYIWAHDNNDNIFWKDAVRYRQEGILDKAESCYLRALRFNPFDPRKGLVARELADLYETLGKHSQAEKIHRLVATLAPPPGLRGGAAEAQECLRVP
ncbi:MAG: glycosyltransferase [Deltaproteobacteria bacterium]|nr:glycosyltransferase [Deltaproteobacteria bacterium]